jgi:hypothetical protein
VDIHSPDILLLQDTMSEGDKIVSELEKMFGGWEFMYLDSRARSGGLVSGWKGRSLSLSNCWSFGLGLGIVLYSQDLGKELKILNIYGPYSDGTVFWDNFFCCSSLSQGNTIVGGDFNFSLGCSQVWGPIAQVDSLT